MQFEGGELGVQFATTFDIGSHVQVPPSPQRHETFYSPHEWGDRPRHSLGAAAMLIRNSGDGRFRRGRWTVRSSADAMSAIPEK
jgi:hypothetical protein